MSIQEMAVENAEKRLKEIDKLDFAISAWADYDNGLTQGFKDGAEAMLERLVSGFISMQATTLLVYGMMLMIAGVRRFD